MGRRLSAQTVPSFQMICELPHSIDELASG
jgi:hypothetical protein